MKLRLYASVLVSLVACSHGSSSWSAPLRVIVSFDSAMPLDDASLLARLRGAANVRVEFIAAVSPQVAAYVLYCPSDDTDCMQAIARLRGVAGVASIEVDHKGKT